ncbi:NAD(P)(+) transhydrogenase (Re/Si-specific) subunit beta [Oleiagrimonas soli]|uniref:NAD(P) transhydrogenase subunit beta n=1 Tax=Oleiagrimonas soli TaxID=1543381 RepID=A0A099CTT2_9GAMM|nr:NAD(P)(+) transhydrogenase (Re/Si-specific) subunit beta [Oleiagrimonas soli]KGI77199.1 NAD(P) transhydrogenase subunit beta [Oleiagrimonas soli]MBB6185630.1 NAD(P) transhydrogenase subunit beta [Oleiagrimonas soli]
MHADVLTRWLPEAIRACYLIAALLFILGLKRMSSPRTARGGVVWAGVGMLLAVLATLLLPGMHHLGLIVLGIAVAGGLAWWSGKRVAMTDMPQMVALYNGMGGGAAAAIGVFELVGAARVAAMGGVDAMAPAALVLAVLGVLIGAVSFSGSLIAFAKLQGWMDRRFVFPGQQVFNVLILLLAVVLGGVLIFAPPAMAVIAGFLLAALAFGLLMTLPIGGADMPVVISLYNALTGLAVAFEGFVLQNEAMIIAGTVVGAAGTLLTQLMAKAMNRSLGNVLFGSFGAAAGEAQAIDGAQKEIEAPDAAVMMAYAERVVIVPGYGMAVAQAQHKIWEFAHQLIERGVKVRFAIHPVAGRMPGHMNVLLAEAGVPYDLIVDMEDVNPEFPNTDVVLVIGANDVVNPVAKTDPASPIYGMPVLDVVAAKQAIVIKRGRGKGFAGIENALFYADNTRMLFGDGQAMAAQLVSELKSLDA